MQTMVPDNTELYIEYEMPDLVVLEQKEQGQKQEGEMKPDQPITTREEMMKYRESFDAKQNMDVMYNQRQERNLNAAAKIHRTASINLKISEKEPYWQDDPVTEAPKEIVLKNHTGYEVYQVRYDSIVEICFQSLTASGLNPTRLHIRISDLPPKHIRRLLHQHELKSSLQVIEDQMDSMSLEVQQILREGDYLKGFEQMVWHSNEKLYKASVMWPCIRIAVLIVVMGIGPSIYLVHFFRRHGFIQ